MLLSVLVTGTDVFILDPPLRWFSLSQITIIKVFLDTELHLESNALRRIIRVNIGPASDFRKTKNFSDS